MKPGEKNFIRHCRHHAVWLNSGAAHSGFQACFVALFAPSSQTAPKLRQAVIR
jgi:hypothetical protein